MIDTEEEEEMVSGKRKVRQYSNKRTKRRYTKDRTSNKDEIMYEDEHVSEEGYVVRGNYESDSESKSSPEKQSSSQSSKKSGTQVIVRKFSLPQICAPNSLATSKETLNFCKPKQRWKQLCNLQHEMTTSVPCAKVKMIPPSAPLVREYRPGNLQKLFTPYINSIDNVGEKIKVSSTIPKKLVLNSHKLQNDSEKMELNSRNEVLLLNNFSDVGAVSEIGAISEGDITELCNSENVVLLEDVNDEDIGENFVANNTQDYSNLTLDEKTGLLKFSPTSCKITKNNVIKSSYVQNDTEKINSVPLSKENKIIRLVSSSIEPSILKLQPTIPKDIKITFPLKIVDKQGNILEQSKTLLNQVPTQCIGNMEGTKDLNINVIKLDIPKKNVPENLNKPKSVRHIQQELALMKVRQSIALQVERDVLRCKEEKQTQEVILPARKVFLTSTSCQTNLFSLVEPGRMVEMMISSDNTENQTKMVSSKINTLGSEKNGVQKLGIVTLNSENIPKSVGTNISSKGAEFSRKNKNLMTSDEPNIKKARLEDTSLLNDPGSASSSEQQIALDAMSVDSGIDMTNIEFQNPVSSKNINIINLNSNVVKQNLSSKSKQIFSFDRTKVNSPKSVFDIIVQHNIFTEVNKNCDNNVEISDSLIEPNMCVSEMNTDSSIVDIGEAAAKITKLKLQAYRDWIQCLNSDENGNIPLHKAVMDENLNHVKRQCAVLCARKENIDIYNNDKETPLHLAILSGNIRIIEMLLSFGAKPSLRDENGNTSLHLAVLHGDIECLTAILNCNNTSDLPLDEFNDEGYAPIHISVTNAKLKETRALVQKGADINLKDAKSGRTPLFHAVEANSGELVEYLLSNNGNPNEPNYSGHTPLSAASEISYNERNMVKKYTITEPGMNMCSKLVSLSSGEEIYGGELLQTVEFEEV